jgi:hypothetical protein
VNTLYKNTQKNNRTAFVSFYESNNISPVSQDITDLKLHFQRRESLLRSLGLIPEFIKGRDVLEFGPGSGHNALYLSSLFPGKYELVDGNLLGVNQTRQLLNISEKPQIIVHHSLFNEFTSEYKYDLVWAEGCLPHQTHPELLLEHMSNFVQIGGCIFVSVSNGISYLSETFRRLFRDRFFDNDGDVHSQAAKLIPYIKPHLQNLRGMSRSVEDWILDSIVQPLQDRRMFSTPDVINCLKNRFDVYSASPRFLTDWRWYKDIVGENRHFNDIALENYYQCNLNLLDYRFNFQLHDIDFGKKIEYLCSVSWDLMCKIESGDESAWNDFFNLMNELCVLLKDIAPGTELAIREAISLLHSKNPDIELNHFPKWWGRGQQYLGLIRNR